jgi:NADPH:quinone reductase
VQALATTKYGPLDQLQTLELPVIEPQRGEVRVRVCASALNPADYKVITGTLKFLHGRNFPMVVGYDFSGTIEALGPGVVDFKIGDDVFGFLPYGMGNQQGAFAEMLVAKVETIALKPAGVSHSQAAASATTGLTAIQSLRDLGGLKGPHTKVLITGVSGGVGSIAVGIARRLGASVTAVGSGKGLDLARELGAETLLDRKKDRLFLETQGPFDVIFDAAAAYRWSQWKKNLKPGGVFVTTLPSLPFVIDKMLSLFSSTHVRFVNAKCKKADLTLLAGWLANGLEVPVDSTIPVRDVAKGLARLKNGEVLGRVVVDVPDQFGK